ncbi:hypothetical protein Sjap_015284 [Stephania japonica]|uniref:Uncharacterized protein n=1 Tax=Stephania japonica TaxID=461633 RepID=A0AAP0IJ39_9MAGN
MGPFAPLASSMDCAGGPLAAGQRATAPVVGKEEPPSGAPTPLLWLGWGPLVGPHRPRTAAMQSTPPTAAAAAAAVWSPPLP